MTPLEKKISASIDALGVDIYLYFDEISKNTPDSYAFYKRVTDELSSKIDHYLFTSQTTTLDYLEQDALEKIKYMEDKNKLKYLNSDIAAQISKTTRKFDNFKMRKPFVKKITRLFCTLFFLAGVIALFCHHQVNFGVNNTLPSFLILKYKDLFIHISLVSFVLAILVYIFLPKLLHNYEKKKLLTSLLKCIDASTKAVFEQAWKMSTQFENLFNQLYCGERNAGE